MTGPARPPIAAKPPADAETPAAAEPQPGRPAAPLRPRDAATLILLRRHAGGAEVLMGRRSAAHVFQPERWVFPGGRLDRADYQARPVTPLPPAVEARLARAGGPARARALALAAVRETFEETGLVLGQPLGAAPPRCTSAWAAFYATGHGPALDGLDYVCRAITPPGRTRRFDARFFVADGERVVGSVGGNGELEQVAWLPLDNARALPLPKITQIVLERLSELIDHGAAPGTRPVPFYRTRHGRSVQEWD